MEQQCPLLVFTDLDGTLIDHDTYRWDPAAPALTALKALGAGLVMASSKTAPEIDVLRNAVGMQGWPAIVENGAGLLAPHKTAMEAGPQYRRLRDVLDGLPQGLRRAFVGFGDMDVSEVAAATGLSQEAAVLAKARSYSEPGLWQGSQEDMQVFLDLLSEHRITAREGGRFLTLSFGRTKADQMASIIAHFRPEHTVALGDAPNDVEMLEAADFGVIIANPHRPPLQPLAGEAAGCITRTTLPGPEGWNLAMLDLITRLELDRG